MHRVLFELWGLKITGWKVIGDVGAIIFSARWFVQFWASRQAKRPVTPLTFWVMSIVGSVFCLAYFIFGKNDSVGVLTNLFPSAVAAYNLYLEIAHRRRAQQSA